MRQISFEESKDIMLSILEDVDAFCRKEGIKYTLGEGSLIGAVRHHGMIPWDDDIDILMLREEYERFCATYKSDKFVLNTYDYKWSSWMLCVKITDPRTIIRNEAGEEPYGLWLTVFPIDNAPDDDKSIKRMYLNIRRYMSLFRVRNLYWSTGSKVKDLFKVLLFLPVYFALLPFSKDYWHNKAEKEMKKYNQIKTKRRGAFSCWFHAPWICSSEVFDEYLDAEFDGNQFMIIKGYDEYLRCQYGDYMQLPPKEKQVPKHDYIAYWKD